MMAWIRTATSLITFGFTIYKFFQIERPAAEGRRHLIGPRQFAMMLVAIGLFSLVLATLENRENLKALGAEYMPAPKRSLSVVVAALVSVLGIIALILIVFRQ
jgi:putative membrane protein